ncbi:MAG: class I SAM-dependent methyltransferase [Methanotrichaceae archaeon]
MKPKEMKPKERIADYWDLRSNSYSRVAISNEIDEQRIWNQSLTGLINKKVEKDDGIDRILDVGTGSGFLGHLLAGMGFNVTGIDISHGMISRAKAISLERGFSFELCLGDAENLPFGSRSFDIVISRHLLWTLPSPKRALDEWIRVLKPGGRIMAIDGNWFDPSLCMEIRRILSRPISALFGGGNPVPFGRFYNPIKHELPLFSEISPRRLEILFREAGLENIFIDSLEDVNDFNKRHSYLYYRVAYKDPVFLVAGEKSPFSRD